MDVSKLNVVAAITPLSPAEIELVSGGKSVVPTKNFFETFTGWLYGGEPPSVQRIPLSQLGAFEQATLDAGGSFARNAANLISIMRADGTNYTAELN